MCQLFMLASVQTIPNLNLAIAFIPAAVVVAILYRWSLGSMFTLYALGRMLLQLLVVGYVLTFVFQHNQPWMVLVVLSVMLVLASWIALRPLHTKGGAVYAKILASVALGGVSTLLLVTQAVLEVEPWFAPAKLIPLAGMIFAAAMNSISIAGERYQAELNSGKLYIDARHTALTAALIPQINTLLAVGLVSLPGMMTGQILANADPLIAARYQIMVMCMIFGSAGISSACFLILLKPHE